MKDTDKSKFEIISSTLVYVGNNKKEIEWIGKQELPSLQNPNIKLEYVNETGYIESNWTNKDLKATIKMPAFATVMKYKIVPLYSPAGNLDNTWIETKDILTTINNISENKTIHIILENEINNTVQCMSKHIEKIDKVLPNDPILEEEIKQGNEVTRKVILNDVSSQIDILASKYIINNIEIIDINSNKWNNANNFTNFTDIINFGIVDTYSIDILSVDKAGNKKVNRYNYIKDVINIRSSEELQSIGNSLNYPLNHKYTLANDIDLTGVNFKPIDNFTGELNGNNNTIKNLNIINPNIDKDYGVGLFGKIENNVKIVNLKIDNAKVETNSKLMYVGVLAGIVGVNDTIAEINNIEITNSKINQVNASYGTGGLIGGVCGKTSINNCKITNVEMLKTSGEKSEVIAGGLVGYINNATNVKIENSEVTGNITTSNSNSGLNNYLKTAGFIGSIQINNRVFIDNCKFTGNIKATAIIGDVSGTGGFIGNVWKTEYLDISRCCSNGTVTLIGSNANWGTAGFIGGIEGVGKDSKHNISKCSSNVIVSGRGQVAGFMGFLNVVDTTNYIVNISDCYTIGSVTNTYDQTGGFIAAIQRFSTGTLNLNINKCYSVGKIIGTSSVGGFIGYKQNNINLTFDNIFWNRTVAGITNDVYNVPSKTTQEMQLSTTYFNWSTAIWNIKDGAYPVIK